MTTNTKRNFLGVWIPAAIWLDRSLSITEKVMLVEINSLQDPERGCYASNEHIAEFFGLSKSRVSEIISNLASKGLIQVDLIREGKQIVARQIWMTETGILLAGGIRPSSENTHTPPLRKTRRTSSENTANLFGKHGEPSSGKAIESNTDSSNTKSSTESNAKSLALVKPAAPEKPPAPTDEVFFAFNDAYFLRYGTNHIRDAKVNGIISNFIKRVGKEEAPHIAAFYVRHNDREYIRKSHPIGLLLTNTEGLRTQWATGRTMTSTRANQLDSTATNANAAQEAIAMLRRRNGNASV